MSEVRGDATAGGVRAPVRREGREAIVLPGVRGSDRPSSARSVKAPAVAREPSDGLGATYAATGVGLLAGVIGRGVLRLMGVV